MATTRETLPTALGRDDPARRALEDAAHGFTWARARGWLDGLPGGGLNIAHEAVVRHARGPRAEQIALRWIGRAGATRSLTYRELDAESSRFANALAALGVAPGERVFALTPRVPALYAAALGTLKHRAVFCPLFSAFGPEPIEARMRLGDARVLVTTAALYARKIAPIRTQLGSVRHVVLVPEEPRVPSIEGTHAWEGLVTPASPSYAIGPTSPDDPALLHFTSGTTGQPKGALHVHDAVAMHHATARLGLDLRPGDVFWCTADPGWVTGTSYGIVAPLACGATLVVDEGELDAERWYSLLERERVSVWYTAPTAVRMLMRAGELAPLRHDRSRLRFAASVGEPLDAEAVRWSHRVLGRALHDTWWQTETGAILLANGPLDDVRPGSMGKPLPGVEAAIVKRDARDEVRVVEAADAVGELAIRPGWPSMFRAYVGAEERYAAAFRGGWYLTGDLARRDGDGYFWFVGRADDVIKSSGHLIGPCEIEGVLVEHPAVAEAAAIGKPDPVAGEIVKAFVVLREGYAPSPALEQAIVGYARSRLGPALAPRELAFTNALPHTRSGKTLRRLLRARELGLPEGDTSTLEGAPA
jgi:acetyl-CoA synthetase